LRNKLEAACLQETSTPEHKDQDDGYVTKGLVLRASNAGNKSCVGWGTYFGVVCWSFVAVPARSRANPRIWQLNITTMTCHILSGCHPCGRNSMRQGRFACEQFGVFSCAINFFRMPSETLNAAIPSFWIGWRMVPPLS